MGHLLNHSDNCSFFEYQCPQVKLQPRVLGVFSKRLTHWTVGPSQLKPTLEEFLLCPPFLLCSFPSIVRGWFFDCGSSGSRLSNMMGKEGNRIGSRKKGAKHFSVAKVGLLCSEALGKRRGRMDDTPVLDIWALLWLLGEELRRVWYGVVRAEMLSKVV